MRALPAGSLSAGFVGGFVFAGALAFLLAAWLGWLLLPIGVVSVEGIFDKGDVVAVRITTTTIQQELPTVVRLGASDRPLLGAVLCDDPYVIVNDDIQRSAGALSPGTMRAVNAAIRRALGV